MTIMIMISGKTSHNFATSLPCITVMFVMFPHLTNCSNAFPKINHLDLVIPDKLHYHLTVRFRYLIIAIANATFTWSRLPTSSYPCSDLGWSPKEGNNHPVQKTFVASYQILNICLILSSHKCILDNHAQLASENPNLASHNHNLASHIHITLPSIIIILPPTIIIMPPIIILTLPPTTSSFIGSLLELLLSHSRTFLSKCPLMITFNRINMNQKLC